MSKPEWGEKHLCPSCNALYYDMMKLPATCPKCNTPYDPEALLKSRRRVTAEDKKKLNEAPEELEDIEIDTDAVADDVDVVVEEDLDDSEIEVEVDGEEKDN